MAVTNEEIIAPNWGEPFVDANGIPLRRPQGWIDSVTRISNTNNSGIVNRLTQAEADIDALELPRTVSTQTSEYTIASALESGVLANFLLSGQAIILPDATAYLDKNFFVENVGGYIAWVVPESSQTISGVDLIGLDQQTPYPICHVKSNGSTWTLLSDRVQQGVSFGFYWEDETGEYIVDENGDELVLA